VRLQLDQVSVGYDGAAVVGDISFTLDEGDIGCLLGPSGCGKTTLLRAIAGFEPVLAGRILGGSDLLAATGFALAAERRGIGMVFQDLALLPHLSVLDNVAFGLHKLPRKPRRARARDLVARVGLTAHLDAYPHQLSGGQQQRVALARALAPQPHLLLLDEPFSALDLELREQLSHEVRRLLKDTGTTALMVTHSQLEAFAIADHVGVLAGGVLRQWDSAYNLYHRPADRMVADFVGEGVFLPGHARDDGSVDIELGRVRPANGGACRAGAVEVLLRPDDVVHDDTSPLRAEVVHKAFRGAEILYTVRLPSGVQVLSLVPSHHDHALGEPIGIRLDLEHVVVFPA
jgi:iron(III) transport system ATP-binding protein